MWFGTTSSTIPMPAARTASASARNSPIAEEIADVVQLDGAVDALPQRHDQHPAVLEAKQVGTFPDVSGRQLGGDRVLSADERAEIGPGGHVLAGVDEHAGRARSGAVSGSLEGVPLSARLEDEGIASVAD